MTHETILSNARLVLSGEVATGSVVIRDGVIAAVDTGASVPAGAEDCEGAWLAPGLVELHTDNLERHMEPRPGVDWPHPAALIAHDAELAACGITTVFDAMRVGSIPRGRMDYAPYARALASEMLAMRSAGAFRISHFLHLRAEICSETLAAELAEFGPDDRVGIVSLMDHTPGARQFTDISKLRAYASSRQGLSDDEFLEHVADLRALKDRVGAGHEAAAVAAARRYGAVIASHDDTTAEHVRVSREHGAAIAEFPTTLEAARASRDAGIAVMMGAPNLVRGGSHSGNVAARDLAEAGLLDILSSDYIPGALLSGAVTLGRLWGDMARGLRTVSAAPARAVGLNDRGAIAPGMRADLLRFVEHGETPIVRGVWSRGVRVA